jgi:hypothetical protein
MAAPYGKTRACLRLSADSCLQWSSDGGGGAHGTLGSVTLRGAAVNLEKVICDLKVANSSYLTYIHCELQGYT